MKKFLSIFLAVAFVFSAMCMSILAADETTTSTDRTHPQNGVVVKDKQYWVVGKQDPTSNDLGNGVTNPNGNTSANITVNFNDKQTGDDDDPQSTIHNRYAIDITYGSLIVDLTNITNTKIDDENAKTIEFVWDVNKHMYVPYNSETGAATNPVENETYEIVIENAFWLTNHSDLEIYYTPTVAVQNDANGNYSSILQLKIRSTGATQLGTDALTDLAAPGTFMVQRATAGTYSTNEQDLVIGKETEGIKHAIVALPTGKDTATQADWIGVINQLSGALGEEAIAGGAKIGTLTVTIAGSTTVTDKLYNATAPTP